MGNTEIKIKFSRLKSIDDDYLERATGGIL